MAVIYTIQDRYDLLTKAEKRVARYCLDNYLDLEDITLTQLADKAQCGEATVFRFCRKINFESYQDFKNAILEEIHDNFEQDEDSFAMTSYHGIQNVIEYTIQNLDMDLFEEICTLIFKADKIFCAGVGNSGIPAEACAMRFLRNGKNGLFFKDNHFQLIYLNEISENDVAILFSYSGESFDTINCAEILKRRGVTIIGITASAISSVDKNSISAVSAKSS